MTPISTMQEEPVFPTFSKLPIYLLFFTLCGCQIGYIANSAYHQADILRRRIPLEKALEKLPLTEEQKQKLKLAIEVRQFMKDQLGLEVDENYDTYVQLDRDYVTYVVSASPKNKLEHYKWHFPIVGSVPYKGYFNENGAKEEAEGLKKKGLDVYVRGVSAFSTLGWFNDPILSSMLNYREHRFVDTLIHETVHANLYIKNQSKFNERIAAFLGMLGAQAFYSHKGTGEEMKKKMDMEKQDDLTFSEFITAEIKKLKNWYEENKSDPELLTKRETQFEQLKQRFQSQVSPRLKTKVYSRFPKLELNNARILLYDLYQSDFSELEKIAEKNNRDFKKVFAYLKSLEDSKDPAAQLSRDAKD